MRGPSRGDGHGYRPLSLQAAADLNAWFIDCCFSLILIHYCGDKVLLAVQGHAECKKTPEKSTTLSDE